MYLKQITGKIGEDLACKYLLQNNYLIIERNFHCSQGEIDIISKDKNNNNNNNELVFIEVKTRTNLKYGMPSEAVNNLKQKHILKACNYYIYKKQIINIPIRIDVLEIFLYHDYYKINHIKQIF